MIVTLALNALPPNSWIKMEERVMIKCDAVRFDQVDLTVFGHFTRREGATRTILHAEIMSDRDQLLEEPITIVIEPENVTRAIKFRFSLPQGVGHGDAMSYSDFNHRFIVLNIFAGGKNLLDRRSSVEVAETGRYAEQQSPEKITSVADCKITGVSS